MDMFDRFAERLASRPHAPVGIFPTPIQWMPRLSARWGRPVYFKRDDLAGLAVGGSKIRVLQHTAGDALARGADLFVAGGWVQSNHPAQVAAVACALGVRAELVLDTTKGYELQGNLLLEDLLGVRVHFVREGTYEALRAACVRLADRLRGRGAKPALLTLTPEIHMLNALAYAEGFVEVSRQLEAIDITDADIFIGSGGPTCAGLWLGSRARQGRLRVHGVPTSGMGGGARERVVDVASRAMRALDVEVLLRQEDLSLLGDGTGVYGFTRRTAIEAIRVVAQAEGVFLDPIYTGNAMAELLRWIPQHRDNSPIVFFHTGGVPALFAYEREVGRPPKKGAVPGRRIVRLNQARTGRLRA